MRTILLCMLVVLGAVRHSAAQDAGQEIRDVITSQIEAFRHDDFVAAFGYASPGIRRMFGTPERFGSMVRRGYPMVLRPEGVQFPGLTQRRGVPVQPVILTDPTGQIHVLDYEMIRVGDHWRINGVFTRPASGV